MDFNFFINYKEVLFAFFVLSPWPIFFSYIFYYALGGFPNYKAVIRSKWDIFKHSLVLNLLLVLSIGIFALRLQKRGKKVDLYNYWETLLGYLKFGSPEESYIILSGLLIIVIFWLLGIKIMYMYVKRSFIVLHAYVYSYDWYRTPIISELPFIQTAYMFYFVNRIKVFTKDPDILYGIVFFIWPTLFEMIEKRLLSLIIPYLYVVDIITNDWVISKVFDVLPWMFLYTGIKGILKNLFRMMTWPICQMSSMLYDFQEIKKDKAQKEKAKKEQKEKHKDKKTEEKNNKNVQNK